MKCLLQGLRKWICKEVALTGTSSGLKILVFYWPIHDEILKSNLIKSKECFLKLCFFWCKVFILFRFLDLFFLFFFFLFNLYLINSLILKVSWSLLVIGWRYAKWSILISQSIRSVIDHRSWSTWLVLSWFRTILK